MSDKRKSVGIIGGMGPGATALLFQKIIDYTDAKTDADHMHIIIDNRPSIPDRTSAILRGDDTPARCICESGRKLTEYGAELLVIPCNTSHYFYPYIQSQLDVPVINMPEETAKECKMQGFHRVGVLATTGTRKTEIYDHALEKYGVEAVYPGAKGQELLMSVIYDYVKAGKNANSRMFREQIEEMVDRGVQAFVLGCTELPLVFHNGDCGMKYIDSLDVLARKTVEMAGYPLKKWME